MARSAWWPSYCCTTLGEDYGFLNLCPQFPRRSSLTFSQTAVVELSQGPTSPLTFQLAPFLSGPQKRFPAKAADLFTLQSTSLNLGSKKKKTNVFQGLPHRCSQMSAKAEAQPRLLQTPQHAVGVAARWVPSPVSLQG